MPMNLKDAFRYQSFLSTLMMEATQSLRDPRHALLVAKTHNRSTANPDAEDKIETIETPEFIENNSMIRFLGELVNERERWTNEIDDAKATIQFDIDAALEGNKFRQTVIRTIDTMLQFKASKTTERGQDFRINANGDQTPYYYNVDVVSTEQYDRAAVKAMRKELEAESENVSSAIDAALVTTKVKTEPLFDMHDSFEDIVADWLAAHPIV